jgi:hypothetical protein
MPAADKSADNKKRNHEEESEYVPTQPTEVNDSISNHIEDMIADFLEEIHNDFTEIDDYDYLLFFV